MTKSVISRAAPPSAMDRACSACYILVSVLAIVAAGVIARGATVSSSPQEEAPARFGRRTALLKPECIALAEPPRPGAVAAAMPAAVRAELPSQPGDR